jgi:hypothetical protein
MTSRTRRSVASSRSTWEWISAGSVIAVGS